MRQSGCVEQKSCRSISYRNSLWELRNIDLNPFDRVGIDAAEIEFIHLFMLYLLWTDYEKLPADEWVAEGNRI